MVRKCLTFIAICTTVLLISIPSFTFLSLLANHTVGIFSKSLTRSNAGDSPIYVDGYGNYEPIDEEVRYGPGEGGKPYLLRKHQENNAAISIKEYGLNNLCSKEISINRAVRDTRLQECRHWNYPKILPTASVIIPFYNEAWSVLLRSIHSILNRTPKALLREIILVDDFSDNQFLGAKLDEYIERYKGRVKIIRNEKREGIIRSKNIGAENASGDILVFLDSHVEVNKNWLPPLLTPIHQDETTVTVPIIDFIDPFTFEYKSLYISNFIGIFEWGLLYKEMEAPSSTLEHRTHETEPYESPTMRGPVAIKKDYFFELGGYDRGLLGWGGDNFDLSFKVWQCGGRIKWVPCSKVGHVFRLSTYGYGELRKERNGQLSKSNLKRVVETWFDKKYKEFWYTREPYTKVLDYGDIKKELTLKEELKCKNFEWYMDNVAHMVLEQYPEPPANVYAGQLKPFHQHKCLDTLGRTNVAQAGLKLCQNTPDNQLMRLNDQGQLSVGERCVDGDGTKILIKPCKVGTSDGPWEYFENNHTLYHTVQNECLAVAKNTSFVSLKGCDDQKYFVQWEFEEVELVMDEKELENVIMK